MKYNEVASLFPLQVEITEKMLKNVDIYDSSDCIGARALKQLNLGDDWIVSWGLYSGSIREKGETFASFNVYSYIEDEPVNMMRINHLCTITLKRT